MHHFDELLRRYRALSRPDQMRCAVACCGTCWDCGRARANAGSRWHDREHRDRGGAHHPAERIRQLPPGGEAALRIRRLQLLLEEVGVSCDDTADLRDLDAVLFASDRGAEALVAARLDDEQRLVAYARLIARLLADDLQAPVDIKIEYTDATPRLRAGSAKKSGWCWPSLRLSRPADWPRRRGRCSKMCRASRWRSRRAPRLARRSAVPPVERLLVPAVEYVPPLARSPRCQRCHRPRVCHAEPRGRAGGVAALNPPWRGSPTGSSRHAVRRFPRHQQRCTRSDRTA